MCDRLFRLRVLFAAALLGLAGACARSGEKEPAATAGPPVHPVSGEVLKVDAAAGTVLLNHEEIPGYMPAMTMEFTLSPGEAAGLREGQRIRAELVPEENGVFRLQKIWPADPAAEATVRAAAGALAQDTMTRGKNAYREVGESMPDFALYDQEGRVVAAGRFRGKQIMMNFIFTRCPVATMCPASTAAMMSAQRKAREAGVDNIEFVSITLDPEFDTPVVLKEYARVHGIDTANFSFLTGPERAIKDLLAQFGVIAAFDGSLLKHTLATLLIDERGRIVHRADGSGWSPDDFVQRMKKPAAP